MIHSAKHASVGFESPVLQAAPQKLDYVADESKGQFARGRGCRPPNTHLSYAAIRRLRDECRVKGAELGWVSIYLLVLLHSNNLYATLSDCR